MIQKPWMTGCGWALTGLTFAFLLVDAGMKLAALQPVLDAGETLGFAGADMNRALGVILLAATLLAMAPPTAVLGAIIITAYLGGAVAAQLRIGAPLGSHILFGVYLGIALWLGLYLRSPRLRALVPFVDRSQG